MVAKKPTVDATTEVDLLGHLVPDQQYAEDYIPRTLPGGYTDIKLLRYSRMSETMKNVLLYGPTGPGKTSLVVAYAAVDKRPLVTIQCNGAIDPATFWGGMELDEASGQYKWRDSAVTLVAKHGGVIYLDEVNFLPPRTAAVFHGALDKRRQITILEHGNEMVKLHPSTQIIAAYNPDYEGTRPLNAAFKNRFSIKVEMDYDDAIESQLLCVPALQQLASRIRSRHKAGEIETPVSTNMLIEFEILSVDLGVEFAKNNFLNAFPGDERPAVSEAFELYSGAIEAQVHAMVTEAEA